MLVGSGPEALQIGNALLDAGVRIAAVVEQAKAITGPRALLARLLASGTRLFTRHVMSRRLVIARSCCRQACRRDRGRLAPFRPAGADRVRLRVLAVAAIPAIELIEAAGCDVSFQPARGGHVALIDRSQRASLPFLYAAGDCAGIWPSKTLSDDTARQEGRVAASAALRALGVAADGPEEAAVSPDPTGRDIALERLAWARAMTLKSTAAPFLCQCEEVTAADVLELQPPRYLHWRDGRLRRPGGPARWIRRGRPIPMW